MLAALVAFRVCANLLEPGQTRIVSSAARTVRLLTFLSLSLLSFSPLILLILPILSERDESLFAIVRTLRVVTILSTTVL